MLREKQKLIVGVQRLLDILITVLSFAMAYQLKRNYLPEAVRGLSEEPNYFLISLLIIIIWYVSFNWGGMYGFYRRNQFYGLFKIIVKSCFIGLFSLNVCLYFLHIQNVSRILMGLFWCINVGFLTISKFFAYYSLHLFRANGFNKRNVLVVGSKRRAVDAIRTIEKGRDSEFNVLGCFEVSSEMIGRKVVNGHDVIGALGQLEEYLRNNVVDELIFAMPLRDIFFADRYVSIAEEMGVTVRIVPDWQLHYLMYRPGIANIRFEEFSGMHTLALHTTPLNEGLLLIKTTVDYLFASMVLLLTWPVFIVVGVSIKMLSKGPVFYRQERLGLNGRRFRIIKFRTMVENADALRSELEAMNEADGPAFKIKDDPRIIPWVGTFLRATSLDELPQFINVLKGEMSVVGPRPPIPSEVDEYAVWQRRRLSMKPGLTCSWQIAPGRNDLSFEEWMRLDLGYIDNWSPLLDMKLVVLTVKVMLMGGGR